MANSCNWDPATNALVITLVPPSKPNLTKGSASVNFACTDSQYSKNAGDGGSNSWTCGTAGGTPWNYQGPAYGAGNTVINVTPKYKDNNGNWQKYTSEPSKSGDTYTFADPYTVQGGGSAGNTSIAITMIEPGGGGLSL